MGLLQECLNCVDANCLGGVLAGSSKPLVSDCDEQIIINLRFHQPVRVHSIWIAGEQPSSSKAPKTVRLFANNPVTLDFDRAQASVGVQEIVFGSFDKAVKGGEGWTTQLNFVRFQNVSNLQLFIIDNQADDEQTVISGLRLFGTPLQPIKSAPSAQQEAGAQQSATKTEAEEPSVKKHKPEKGERIDKITESLYLSSLHGVTSPTGRQLIQELRVISSSSCWGIG